MTSGDTGGALVKKKYPIRGILWGIPFGLGLAVVLVLTKVIPLEQAQVVGVFFLGLVIGLLWSLFGPAKKPKGAAPAAGATAAAQVVDQPPISGDDEGSDEGTDSLEAEADDAADDSGGGEGGDTGEQPPGY